MTETTKATRLAEIVHREAFEWGDNVADAYHGVAASQMDNQWNRIVWPILSKHAVDLSVTMDFACGYGRNARKLREVGAKLISLVDVNPDNIAYCNEHLVPLGGYETFQNNGYDLAGLPNEKYSHIYSFDAMVHFDIEIILSYISEFSRVLKPGGTIFVHHSNFTARPGSSFRDNPHWRNFMSDAIFQHAAIRSGFEILHQERLTWGGQDIDCITVARRISH